MSGGHAFLPPSGAKAWRQCPMWPTMNQRYPQDDTPATLEGNAAHWVAWEVLAGREVLEGSVTPCGQTVTDEMLDGAELLVDTVKARNTQGAELIVERKLPEIDRIHPECWGTPDIRFYTTGALDVIDYKFGHKFVDEFENDQCVTYVAGILDELSDGIGLFDQHTMVNITIVQPRCFLQGAPVRTWSVLASTLRGQINQLGEAGGAAVICRDAGDDAMARTGDECGFCPGRHACKAYQESAYLAAEISTRSAPVELTPAAADLELRMLERALARLEGRVTGLRESVAAHARSGAVTPFHRLEQGVGRAQWSLPVDQVLAMGQLFNANLAKPGIVTPNQAVKLGVDAAVINAYTTKPLGAMKLVPDNSSKARKVFGLSQSGE